MPTKRQSILATAKTLIDSVTTGSVKVIKFSELTKPSLPDFDGVPYPCAYISMPTEMENSDDYAIIGKENWKGDMVIEIWVDGNSDIEVVLGEVKKTISANRRFGGYACFSKNMLNEQFIIDPLKERQGMFLHYDVYYFNDVGTP